MSEKLIAEIEVEVPGGHPVGQFERVLSVRVSVEDLVAMGRTKVNPGRLGVGEGPVVSDRCKASCTDRIADNAYADQAIWAGFEQVDLPCGDSDDGPFTAVKHGLHRVTGAVELHAGCEVGGLNGNHTAGTAQEDLLALVTVHVSQRVVHHSGANSGEELPI